MERFNDWFGRDALQCRFVLVERQDVAQRAQVEWVGRRVYSAGPQYIGYVLVESVDARGWVTLLFDTAAGPATYPVRMRVDALSETVTIVDD